jgi:hypothetical protein
LSSPVRLSPCGFQFWPTSSGSLLGNAVALSLVRATKGYFLRRDEMKPSPLVDTKAQRNVAVDTPLRRCAVAKSPNNPLRPLRFGTKPWRAYTTFFKRNETVSKPRYENATQRCGRYAVAPLRVNTSPFDQASDQLLTVRLTAI